MNRKIIILAMALALVAVPVFAQFRADLGVSFPFAQGEYKDGNFTWSMLGSGTVPIIPVPDVGLYFQIPLGFVRIGGGIRALPLFFINFAWPNLIGEIHLGNLIIEAQLGGGALASYIPGSTPRFVTGAFLLPDLSVWLALGQKKRLRIGAGAFGLTTTPEKGEDIKDLPVGMLFYAGVKFVLD